MSRRKPTAAIPPSAASSCPAPASASTALPSSRSDLLASYPQPPPKRRSVLEIVQSLTPEERAYLDFVMEPLREVAKKKNCQPQTLDEAAKIAGYPSFEEYHTIRHRQWMLVHLPAVMERGKQTHKDKETGQGKLF